MKKEGYYSTGEFMKQANITKKTIRYYDEKNILKPSFVSDSRRALLHGEGSREAPADPPVKVSWILAGRYQGMMQVDDADKHFIVNSLNIQQKLVEDPH